MLYDAFINSHAGLLEKFSPLIFEHSAVASLMVAAKVYEVTVRGVYEIQEMASWCPAPADIIQHYELEVCKVANWRMQIVTPACIVALALGASAGHFNDIQRQQ